ncbi:hypothetical protein VTJ04DRAFT_7756 [Mycothermus thermophilus]|uniref:uncharacterized protein n=1 Tax=Humicola insolens TaxID=85995 RepID=UPI0037426091
MHPTYSKCLRVYCYTPARQAILTSISRLAIRLLFSTPNCIIPVPFLSQHHANQRPSSEPQGKKWTDDPSNQPS